MIVESICVAACTDCGWVIVDFEWQFVDHWWDNSIGRLIL